MKKIFIVSISTGEKIRIEDTEVVKLLNGIKNGNIIVFKQGIVNTSFITGIIEAKEINKKIIKDLENYEYLKNKYPEKEYKKPNTQLENVFENIINK